MMKKDEGRREGGGGRGEGRGKKISVHCGCLCSAENPAHPIPTTTHTPLANNQYRQIPQKSPRPTAICRYSETETLALSMR